MNLVDMSGKEISILVDTMDVIDQVVVDSMVLGSRDRPDMILSGEYVGHINEILLTG
jgi:hypothetical protein